MITVTTTVFKKTTLALIGLACAAGIVFSVGLRHQNDTEVQAATTETRRVWFTSTDSAWFKDSAATYIHYWGGAVGTSWPGVATQYDTANAKYYFDLPNDVPSYMFVRCNPSNGAYWSAKTSDLSYASSVGKIYTVTTLAWHPSVCSGSYSSFSPLTTTVVSNFAATIDTDTEACSESSAQAAVNAYNALSTFEQDQFDVLSVGGGFTGLQRLNFLKTFYSISTPLNINNIGDGNNSDDSLMTMLIIGAIGLTTLGGYYIISRKKHLA